MATLQQIAPAAAHERLLLNNILVATDFSELSDTALEYAIFFAKHYKAKINLAHVINPAIPSMEPSLYDLLDRERKIGESQLAAAEAKAERKNVACESFLRFGESANVINDLSRSNHMDLIVCGTSGSGGVERLALGSTAEAIFRTSKRPVLTVGPSVPPIGKNPICMVNILFATDFGAESLRAVPYVISFAQEFQTFLYLAHFVPKVDERKEDKQRERELRQQLKALMPDRWENWSMPAASIGHGDAVEGILSMAKKKRADLIVLGARKAPAFANHLRAGVAYQIAARASCPVLTVT